MLRHQRDAGSELSPTEGLAEGPATGSGVVGDDRAAVARAYAEGEGLAVQERVALPVLAPVARHGLPPGALAFDSHRVDVAGAAYVGDEDEVEVGVAVDGEPDAALLVARNPVQRRNARQIYNFSAGRMKQDAKELKRAGG
jgi:hypothetical protein